MPELICYCFRIEKEKVVLAIEQGCKTVDEVSNKTRACTGCGGCYPDIENLLRFYQEEAEHPKTQ